MEVIRGLSSLNIRGSQCSALAVSRNPQTFNQALLLISNMARLAPDSVLFNVMPVFTFMGSNIFHRDDSHSFKIVQQVCVDTYTSILTLISPFRRLTVLSQLWHRHLSRHTQNHLTFTLHRRSSCVSSRTRRRTSRGIGETSTCIFVHR